MVSQGFHSDLHKDEPGVFNNNLFWYAMNVSGPSTPSKELHVLIILHSLGLPGLEAPPSFAHKSLHYIALLG